MSGNDRAVLQHYFPELKQATVEQLLHLTDLVATWNQKINLVSRQDIEKLMEHHILHALALDKIIEFEAETKIMDVGTGGGFPAIPLAILHPEVEFLLVDSVLKKMKAVSDIAVQLGLTNIRTKHQRVEKEKERVDFVLGRAVTNLPRFVGWVKHNVRSGSFNALPNGIFYWKGGDLEPEIQEEIPDHKLFYLEDYFEPEIVQGKYIVYLPISLQ